MHNMYCFIFCWGLLINVLPALAQDSLVAEAAGRHIRKMNGYLSLKLSLNDNLETFVVTAGNTRFDLRPNNKTVAKLSFNYRFVSFNISATPKFLPGNSDNWQKGRSRFTNYSLNLNFDRWMQALSYSRSRGYYLENTRDYRSGWREGTDPYIQFPQLVYQSYQGQTACKFNKKFSFNAVSTQTERQLKSAGTFLPALSYRYYVVDDKTPLTPQNQTQKDRNIELLLTAGYFYNVVIKQRFYISGGIVPGAGFIFSTLYTRAQSETVVARYNNPVYKLETGIGLGYNGERFFTGAQLQASAIAYSRKNVSNVIQNDRAFYQLFVGYRFAAPKPLRLLLDKADEKRAEWQRKTRKGKRHISE